MRKIILAGCVGVGLLVAACLTAPGEPGTSVQGLTCTAVEREFNGGCRKICATSADCAAPTSCATVATGLSLCVDASTTCTYLGTDTECFGVPYGSYYGNGYDASFVPYSTPYAVPYSSVYGGGGAFACAGNATWQTVPPITTDDPKCGEHHAVVRCEKVGGSCALVAGATMDVAEP